MADEKDDIVKDGTSKAAEAVDPDAPNQSEIEKALAVLSKASPALDWTARLGNVGVALQEWRNVIIEDLGGDEEISAMERMLADILAKSYVMLDMIDQYIYDKYDQKIIDFDRQQARFIVMQRRALADSVARYLKDLGLKKRRRVKHVDEIIAEIMQETEDEKTIEISTDLDAKAIRELRAESETKE